MTVDAAGLNVMADAFADTFTYLALFDGTTELTGGGYARLPVTNAAAAGGVVNITGTPYTFNVPSGATVDNFALFDALTGGNRGNLDALSASEGPYGADGEYDFTAGSVTVANP